MIFMDYEDTIFNETPEQNAIDTYNATIEEDFPIGSFSTLVPQVEIGNETYKIREYFEFELIQEGFTKGKREVEGESKIVKCDLELFNKLYGRTKPTIDKILYKATAENKFKAYDFYCIENLENL